jgi:hypothetical protein
MTVVCKECSEKFITYSGKKYCKTCTEHIRTSLEQLIATTTRQNKLKAMERAWQFKERMLAARKTSHDL